MKHLVLGLLCLVLTATAFGQTTSVTLQVTDTSSQSWNNGTYSAVLTPPPGSGPVQFLLSGVVMTPGQITVTGNLNASGGATFSLSQNAAITPVNTTWTITVCPQATGSCYKAGASIFGATQNVTLTPPPILITLANPPYSATAYADSEITGVVVGSQYYNLTNQIIRVCTVVSASNCTSWVNGSGGGISPGTSGAIPYSVTASPACPILNSVAGNTCQFVFDDGYAVATDVTTNSSTTITCPNNDCNFTTITQPTFGSTIVGMQAWVTQTSTVASSPVPVCPISAITAVAAQSITVTTTCTGNLTAAGTLYIGHKDTTNLSKAWTTAGCGTLTLPTLSANPIAKAGSQAVMLVDSGEFNTQPTSCTANGTTGFYGSPAIVGTPVSTTLLMTPDFPFTTGACTGVASAGITGSYNVCFGPGPVIWYGVDVVGAGFASCGTAALVIASAGAGGAMSYSNHDNICVSNVNLIGTLLYSADYRFLGGGVQNIGGIAMRAPASNGFPVYINTSLLVNDQATSGNTDIGLQVDSGAIVIDNGSNISNSLINGAFDGMGTIHMSFNGGSGQNASAQVGATGNLDCTGCTFNSTQSAFGSPGNSSVGLYLHNSGARAALRSTNSWQGAPAGGFAFFTVAGTIYTDAGGNAGPTANGGTAVSVSGNIINEVSSANLLPVVAGNLVLSAGWGSTAAVSAPSGGNSPIKFTITNSGTGQAASPTIAYTFPNGFFVAPYSCTATQIGGTNAVGTFTSSSLTSNGVTFTFSLTPTASSTEIVQVSCVTP